MTGLLGPLLALLALAPLAQSFLPSPVPPNLAGTERLRCLLRAAVDRTWTHRNITEEAMKRTAVRRFRALANDRRVDYGPDELDTVANVFIKFHGFNATGAGIAFAVVAQQLADEVARVDSGPAGLDPRYHFDAERLSEAQKLLQLRHQQLVTSLVTGGRAGSALRLLALQLAAIQDFYSHSSWIDLEKDHINYALGMPGQSVGSTAGPSDTVCSDCDSADGTCYNNVLRQGRLTSGYLSGQFINGITVSKPANIGKCSHGGVTDQSRVSPAVGGISKDSMAPCFSPHHYSHSRAAEFAVQASEQYLSSVLAAVGEQRADWLLRLSPRQCLVLALDISQSMAPALTALRQRTARLALLESRLRPSCYVLVPFSGAGVGPVRVTASVVEFQRHLDTLRPVSGDSRRLGVSALLTAADTAPAGSDIYLVTDRPPTDTGFHLQLLQLVADAGSTVNLILLNGAQGVFGPAAAGRGPFGPSAGPSQFGPLTKSEPISSAKDGLTQRQRVRYEAQLYPIEVYKNISKSSGGLILETGAGQAAEALQILDLAANNSKSTIFRRYDVGFPSFSSTFGVDRTVSQLEVTITGTMTSGRLVSPRGTRFDLRSAPSDEDSRPDASRVRTPVSSAGVTVVQLDDPVEGDWKLDLASPDFYYPAHVAVRAITNLDIRASVVYLADQGLTHPGMQVVRGKLVTGSQGGPLPHVLLQLISTDERPFRSVDEVLVIDLAGKVLGQLPYNTGPLWDAYLPLDPHLLSQPANVRVTGTGREGGRWVREAPLQATLSSVALSPVKPEAGAARPGQSGQLQFTITNEGRYLRTFNLQATDDLGYFQSLSEPRLTLGPRQSRVVTLRYYVPPSARPGDSATLLVSALTDTLDDGTAAHQTVTVLAQEEDISAPTCTVQPGADVDCGDNLSEDDCGDRLWTVDIETSDTGSGLQEVHVFPSGVGQLTTDQFVVGIQRLRARYRASCCHPKANITAVDRLGNIGICTVDLGNVSYGPVLSSTSIGLVIGAALIVFLLLVLLVGFLVSRRRRSRASRDLPTLEQQRRRERHTAVPEGSGESSHM